MVDVWFWLMAAIAAEVSGTVALKFAEGFTRPVPSVIVVLGYGVAFYALSQALASGMVLGVAYGVWSAVGVALIAVIGAVFLGQGLALVQVGGIVLIIGGVLALELGGSSHAA